MFARRTWYYGGWSHELGDKPFSRRLLGEQVPLFRDGAGTAHAIGALCPQRGTDLGQGRVVDGAVGCPFHGWRYNGEGGSERPFWVRSGRAGAPVATSVVSQ